MSLARQLQYGVSSTKYPEKGSKSKIRPRDEADTGTAQKSAVTLRVEAIRAAVNGVTAGLERQIDSGCRREQDHPNLLGHKANGMRS